jgi:hypothetical protein
MSFLNSLAAFVGIDKVRKGGEVPLTPASNLVAAPAKQATTSTKRTAKWQGPYYYRNLSRSKQIAKARRKS